MSVKPLCNRSSTYYSGNVDEEGLDGEGLGEVVVGHQEGGLALELESGTGLDGWTYCKHGVLYEK